MSVRERGYYWVREEPHHTEPRIMEWVPEDGPRGTACGGGRWWTEEYNIPEDAGRVLCLSKRLVPPPMPEKA